jgi:hypothetical protein
MSAASTLAVRLVIISSITYARRAALAFFVFLLWR